MTAIRIVALAALLSGCWKRSSAPLPPAPVWNFAGGYHFGPPAKVSVGLGISRVFARQIGRWEPCTLFDGFSRERTLKVGCHRPADSVWVTSWHSDREVFLIAEPGLKGGRLSLGSGIERGNARGSDLSTLRFSLYRRWDSDRRDPGGTYLGVEGAAVAMGNVSLGLRVGLFARVAGPAGGASTLLALDLPIGY